MLQDTNLSSKKRARVSALASAMGIVPVIALSALALNPTPTQAFDARAFCIDAQRLDDPTIKTTRCQAPVVAPPTATSSPTTSATAVPTSSSSTSTSPTATPTPTPTATATPTASPTPTPLPTGIVPGEVFLTPVTATTDMRKLVALNDGGMIVGQSDGVWVTSKRRATPYKLVGMNAALASPFYIESSSTGQVIALANDRYIQVSFDSGTTWQPMKEINNYVGGTRISSISVAENGGLTAATGSLNGTSNFASMSIYKGGVTWYQKLTGTNRKLLINTLGNSVIIPDANSFRFYSDQLVAGTNQITPSTIFGSLVTSGDQKTQLASLNSTVTADKTAGKDGVALRISRNSGQAWSWIFPGDYKGIQISSDGKTMTAIDPVSGLIKVSFDSAVTWTTIDPIGGNVKQNNIKLSYDGKTMFILGTDGKMYYTTTQQATP